MKGYGNHNARGEGNGTKLGKFATDGKAGYDVYMTMSRGNGGVKKKKSGKKGMVKY